MNNPANYHLANTATTPIPPNGKIYTIQTSDNIKLRAVYWERTGRLKSGTICIFQGRSEFIEKYFEVITELRRKGFAVVAFDWRGQGGSERLLSNPKKGHIDNFDLFLSDIAAIITQIIEPLAPKPWFGLSHSMGAVALMRALNIGETRLERVIFASPMVKLERVPSIAKGLAYLLDYAGFGGCFVPSGGDVAISEKPFEGNKLSSDPVRYAKIADILKSNPDLALGDPTISWVSAAFSAMHELQTRGFGSRISTPSLVITGGSDPLCSSPAALELATRIRLSNGIEIIGAKHELLMEREMFRQQFWAAFDAFIPGEVLNRS